MTEPRWLDEDESAFWRAFLAVCSGVTSSIDSELKASSGISLDDFEVLVHLSEAKGRRLRMSGLSDVMLHSRSRLSQRVDRLVARGFVEKKKASDDARGTWAVLTPTGHSALELAAKEHVGHVRAALFDHLTSEEVSTLRVVFERLAKTARN